MRYLQEIAEEYKEKEAKNRLEKSKKVDDVEMHYLASHSLVTTTMNKVFPRKDDFPRNGTGVLKIEPRKMSNQTRTVAR